MYNGLYPVNIKPYTPPVRKKQQDILKDSENFRQNTQEADNQDLSSSKKSRQYTPEKVTINKVLNDFSNTIKAIGAPQETQEEVQKYLNLIEIQSNKEIPSKTIIKSNLKNAAYILDEYISTALNKPSKVVIDWVNAVLLQDISYKSKVSTNEETKEPQEPSQIHQKQTETTVNQSSEKIQTE
ncbi:MAG: hypothetical protein PHV68_01220, partial [Candidatus Gastranaerophilales bacterium]|nr:hypothetical protein [Candidatus Gastranaerophilales bacterium]